MSFDGGSSKGSLDIQENPNFKKRFSNEIHSKFPKACDEKVPKTKAQKGKGGISTSKKPTCTSVVRSCGGVLSRN